MIAPGAAIRSHLGYSGVPHMLVTVLANVPLVVLEGPDAKHGLAEVQGCGEGSCGWQQEPDGEENLLEGDV